MPRAEILSQGDEVVTGQIADTNAAWLAARLTDLGFTVTRHTSVGDDLEAIEAQLSEVSERADFAVCTGGLGPTNDDLTAQAVASAFERPLHFDEHAMATIAARYAQFGRQMPKINRKQAYLPQGCDRLDNDWGTAPGFALKSGSCLFAFMPGVPREMHQMFEVRVLPLLHERFDVKPGHLVTVLTCGLGESNLQELMGNVDNVVVSFRTKLPENHIKLRFTPGTSEADVRSTALEVVESIGRSVFAIEGLPGPAPAGIDGIGGSLAEVIGRALKARGATLAVAESCTGGRVSALCTGIPGSSAWFNEGVVTYSNAAKIRLLGVEAQTIEQLGAVSEPVAMQMARGVRSRSSSNYGLSTTGIAGPGGGSANKPVGTVHIALDTPDTTEHRMLRLPGGRDRVQSLAAGVVLDLLRRHLQSK